MFAASLEIYQVFSSLLSVLFDFNRGVGEAADRLALYPRCALAALSFHTTFAHCVHLSPSPIPKTSSPSLLPIVIIPTLATPYLTAIFHLYSVPVRRVDALIEQLRVGRFRLPSPLKEAHQLFHLITSRRTVSRHTRQLYAILLPQSRGISSGRRVLDAGELRVDLTLLGFVLQPGGFFRFLLWVGKELEFLCGSGGTLRADFAGRVLDGENERSARAVTAAELAVEGAQHGLSAIAQAA